MTAEELDPAEAIAQALSRLRPRRAPGGRGHGGPRGWREPHGEHADHSDHGMHGAHGDPRGGVRRGAHGAPPWAPDPAGRMGGPARMRILEALAAASTPLGVGALAEEIGVDQPRASRLVQQGVERGWVRREADPDDARRTRIVLTDEGRRVLRGVRGERREVLGRALEALSPAEQAELARLLAKLADNWR